MSEANKDDALKCAGIARRALDEGDLAKADRFAAKARQLFSCREVLEVTARIESAKSGAAGNGDSRQPNGASTPPPAPRGSSTPEEQTTPSSRGGNAEGRNSEQAQGRANGTSTSGPTGMGGSRRAEAASTTRRRHPENKPVDENAGTPDQRGMVRDILKAGGDLYAILGVSKTASDDEIKKAYRRLALKLHPDKNTAARAEDAFKALTKAFSCLSDPDKRAYYDRTGYESTAAAQAAANGQRGVGRSGPSPGMYYQEDFDPEQIFNMFFGGMSPQMRGFRTGGSTARRQQQQAQQQQAQQERTPTQAAMMSFMQFLPVVLLLFFSFFSASTPSYSLSRTNYYADQMRSSRLDLPFFVQNRYEFEKSYPKSSSTRMQVERQVESDYYERLGQRCNQERLHKQRLMYTWSQREQARAMKLPACDEYDTINKKLRVY